MVTVTKKAVTKKTASKKPTAKRKVRAKVADTPRSKTTARKKVVSKKISANKKAAEVTAKQVIVDQIETLIDDYGKENAVLESRMKRIKPLAKSVAEKQATILSLVDEYLPVAGTAEYSGEVWSLEVGQKGVKTTIKDVIKLYNYLEALREGLGDELMTFPIGDVKSYLNPEEQRKFLKEKREGKRSTKIEPK